MTVEYKISIQTIPQGVAIQENKPKKLKRLCLILMCWVNLKVVF